MANMSYCRFENTLADLDDCRDALEEDPEKLSDSEKAARYELIQTCQAIADEYGFILDEE